MPRVADNDERRAQIARAYQRLLAAQGFAAVTFSKVAAESGFSVGLVQHYFANKDTLLRFGYEDALNRMSQRVRSRVRNGEAAGHSIAEVLLDSLLELLPLDEEREVEYQVRQGLRTQASHHRGLAEVARRSGGDLLGYVAAVVRSGIAQAEVSADTDPDVAARMILAVTQGLADQVMLSGAATFPVREVLATGISAVFSEPIED